MKKYLFIIVSVFIGISLLTGCGGGSGSSSSSENASVKITLTKNNIPLKNTEITLNGVKKSYTETTDSQGLAEFEKIYDGAYTIHIEGCENTFSLNAIKDRTISVSIDTERENKEYTVIFYANSYNLDEGLVNNLKQMYQYGSTAKTNICVLYKTSQSHGIYRGLVNKNESSDITEGLEKLPNANFGKPSLLRDFIIWSQTNYPAEKYILVLWNHGTGWTPYWDTKAINHDDDYKDWLECYEIHEAVTGLGLTAICMDACCMQMAEVLTQIKNDAQMCLASQEEIPANGYNYTDFFTCLNKYDSLVQAFSHFGKNQIQDTDWKYFNTDIHLTDLSQTDSVNMAIKKISVFLKENASVYGKEISLARQETPEIDYYEKDFETFAENVSRRINSREFDSLLSEYRNAVSSALLYNGKTKGKNGLGINLPNRNDYLSYFGNYSKTEFAGETGWDRFLGSLL